MSGRLGSIYAGMCSELEPEQNVHQPTESWNASVDTRVNQQRYRSDSDSSTGSDPISPMYVQSPTYSIPQWHWPESKRVEAISPISEPLKPTKTI